MVKNALQYLVVFDWRTFEPLVEHLKERYGVATNNWANFEWLADEDCDAAGWHLIDESFGTVS